MDKFTIYHTGLDAVVFLLSNKTTLCLDRDVVLSLGKAFEMISAQMSNKVFDLTEMSENGTA